MSYIHFSPLLKKSWLNTAKLSKETVASEELVRKAGIIYSVYRILVGIFLILTNSVSNELVKRFGDVHQNIFSRDTEYAVLGVYMVFGLCLAFLLIFYKKQIRQQIFFGFAFDAIALSVLMYSGIAKDLQIVLSFMVITASSFMLLKPHHGIIVMLIAILSLIFQQTYYAFTGITGFLTFTDALLLSLSLVAVGFVSWSVSKRIASAESAAHTNAKEIDRLNAINQEVIKNMVNGVIVINSEGGILVINETARQLLRLTPKSAKFNDLSYMSDLENQIANQYQKLIDWYQYDDLKPTFLLTLPQEQEYPANTVRINKKPLPEYGKLLILEDVSREESHAQQLKLAGLGQLSASIAHEIRNPLGAISYASQILMESTDDSDDNKELYEMIYNQTKRVNRIIEDVMRLSRQEPPVQEILTPKSWLIQFLKQYYKGESIKVRLSQNKEILFDPHHLEQIMINLVTNALRHTKIIPDEPAVFIHVHGSKTHLFLDVMDNGDGVKESDVPNLFNPFFTKSVGGTGLGLYLSKAFSEANHARLIYLPNHTKTCFRLIIPIRTNILD